MVIMCFLINQYGTSSLKKSSKISVKSQFFLLRSVHLGLLRARSSAENQVPHEGCGGKTTVMMTGTPKI
jgi:hypothetical protein